MSRAGADLTPPGAALAAGYRPWLDGLRAVAVLMVVAQHVMGAGPVDLGFVGVGLFFGLSGYLITALLLDERARRGSVALPRFYLRRTARLLPALVLVVTVCDVLFFVNHDYRPIRGSIAVLSYLTNYAIVINGTWVPGFGPTWSLAIEEHFYLLWPLVLLGVIGRYGLRAALKATLAVCLAAFLWRGTLAALHVRYILLSVGDLERADALLYGCAAAIATALGWRPRRWILWVGVATVAAMPLALNRETYPVLVLGSAALAVGAAALVVGLDYSAPTWLRRLLSARLVVMVGVVSYGIYLWHGPLMRVAADFGYTGRGWRAVVAILSVGVAWLSHRYMEAPIRSWAKRRTAQPPPKPRADPVLHP